MTMDTDKHVFWKTVWILALLGTCFAFFHVRLAWTDGDEGRYLAISSSIAKGLGQVEEYYPVPQPETITPSGYVWYLAAWIRAFGSHLEWVRLSSVLPFVGFVACFAAFVLRRSRRAGIETWLAGCLVVFGAFQVQLLRYAWNLMSETTFLCLTYLFFALQEEKDPGTESCWTDALLGVLAACATLVRPVGIALALAGGIHFLFRRHWKALFSFSAAFAVAYAPQVIRAWCLLGVPFAHMTHYHATGSMLQSLIVLLSTMWKGWIGYYFRSVPSDLFFYLFDGDGIMGKLGLSFLVCPALWLIAAIIAIGFFRRVPRLRMADWFWMIFWALVCTYDIGTEAHAPGAFRFNPRFLVPVLPMAALYFASGIDWGAQVLAQHWKWALHTRNTLFAGFAAYAFLISLAVGAICLKNTWQFRGHASWSPVRVASSGNADDVAFARYIETCTWAASNLPPNAVIASRKPQQTFLFSGLKGFRYDSDWLDDNVRDVWQNAVSYGLYGPVYLLQDAFPATGGYGNTRVQILDPLIAAHQDGLSLVYATEAPVTRLWLISSTAQDTGASPISLHSHLSSPPIRISAAPPKER